MFPSSSPSRSKVYALCGAGSLRATARGLNKQIKNGGDEETQLKTAVWVENIQNTAGKIDVHVKKRNPFMGVEHAPSVDS